MRHLLLVCSAVSIVLPSLAAAADSISKPSCVEIKFEKGNESCPYDDASRVTVVNNCAGPVTLNGRAVMGGRKGDAVPESEMGAFSVYLHWLEKYKNDSGGTLPPNDGQATNCYRPGTLKLSVTEVNGGKKEAEKPGKGGIVAFNNLRSGTLQYEIRSGQLDGCDPSRDEMITNGSLEPNKSIRLDCKMNDGTQRVGYCYRWKDARESSFGSWRGFVCPRSDRPDSRRPF